MILDYWIFDIGYLMTESLDGDSRNEDWKDVPHAQARRSSADLILDIGYWIFDIGYWIFDIGYLILGIGYLILGIGYLILCMYIYI